MMRIILMNDPSVRGTGSTVLGIARTGRNETTHLRKHSCRSFKIFEKYNARMLLTPLSTVVLRKEGANDNLMV